MKRITTKKVISWIDQHLYDPRHEPEALLRKRWAWIWMAVNLLGVAIMTIIALFIQVWQTYWFAFGLIFVQIIALLLYPSAKRFDLVINVSYAIIILITFVAIAQMGGLKTSLGLVFIGLNCAMGSVLAGNLRWSVSMFIIYGFTIILLGVLNPYLPTPDYITSEINILYFVMVAVWVNAVILFLTVFYMKDKSRFEKTETERVKKLDDAKTQLYTNVSHEFRTPLTIIQGIAEQMDEHPEKWQLTGTGKIKTQSQVLLRLVNQMLDISKIEANGMHLNLINGDIKKYVKYIVSSFYSLGENKDIALQVIIDEKPLFTDYDPEKLMQVLANLLSNAIKFTNPGGNVYIEVLNITENDRNQVCIRVRDDGRGIPQEDISRIFERFYQVPDVNDQTQGTGLGLALTRELIYLMKGKIDVNSKLGEGTEFIVTFPVSQEARLVEDDGVAMAETINIQSIIPIPEERKKSDFQNTVSDDQPILLIVEDNQDVVEYLVATLEGHYIIELASNGKQGLEKAITIIPDIILTDVMMPQMDGFELLGHLKNDLRTDHIPVVVLTAKADIQSKLKGLEIGADHYLIKPFSEKELYLKLNNLLEARQKMQHKLGVGAMVSQPVSTRYKQELKFIARINKLLDERLHDEDFGIKDICLSFGMSRPQLYRKFSALTNKTIGRYIRSFRLHKAKMMIETEGKNVTEAAFDSGFKNLSHFSTIFREEFGYPPSELI